MGTQGRQGGASAHFPALRLSFGVLSVGAMQSRNNNSKRKGSYERHDPLYFAAKKQGYAARSVFKLEEIDKDFSLLRTGDFVVDLGCSPGSWLQYTSDKIGTQGIIVGVDVLPVKIAVSCGFHFMKADVFEVEPECLLEFLPEAKRFDILLSDMAPNTSGIKSLDQDRSMVLCEQALTIARGVVRRGGRFCVKILEGGGMNNFIKDCRDTFEEVKIRRPKGTRSTSMETYVIGLRRK
jgi:23S rRNA (uridine2552-2'-O)-methyltransferase